MSAGMNLGMNLGMSGAGSADGFDPAFYVQQNPGVVEAGFDPLQHYLQYGAAEGRAANASDLANGKWSLISRGDVLTPAGQATVDAGKAKAEKSYAKGAKDPFAFDPDYYLSTRPDVKAADVDPLQHYLQFGIKEGSPRNAYAAANGLPGADPATGMVGPPPTQAPLDPNDPASWAAWKQMAAAQTQGLNRMPGVAPDPATLSADPLAVRAQFYPKGNNAGFTLNNLGMKI